MRDVAPQFPILLKYTDWELGYHADFDDFLNASGWEEFDFPDDFLYAIDSHLHCFLFDRDTQTFYSHPAEPRLDLKTLQVDVLEHLARAAPQVYSPEEIETWPTANLLEIIRQHSA